MKAAELITEIIELQRKIDRGRRQYEVEFWMSLPITMSQLKCLFFISNEGSTNAGKIAKVLRVTPTNITGIIDRLVEQGLVTRSENPKNRRFLLLKVTGKGEKVVNKLRERKRDYLFKVLAKMKTKDLSALYRGLIAFNKASESLDADVHKIK